MKKTDFGIFCHQINCCKWYPNQFFLVKMSYNLPKYCLEVVDHAKHQFPNILISALRRPILEPFLFTVQWAIFFSSDPLLLWWPKWAKMSPTVMALSVSIVMKLLKMESVNQADQLLRNGEEEEAGCLGRWLT